MASRQSVSSILKPPKVRAPLKEIEAVDQDADENTATSSKRKVSFSGMNKIKMYNTCATSLTVNQAPMFDEKNSISSDTLNGDGIKTPGKFDKSDVQTTFESTDCTNVENNGRVIIEYESPSDNMEMTEAKAGKLHESMFLIDNYDSECMNSSLDNSETNMEFTEAKVGNIFTADMESDFSSTEMLSETLYSECGNNLGTNISTSLPDISKTKIFDKSSNSNIMEFTCTNTKSNSAAIESSNMEFTCTNTKLNSMANESCNMEFTCTNTKSNSLDIGSSNMELTCMTVKFKKSAALNHSSISMELTQVPDKQISEDCSELMYETSIESDTLYDGKNNSNCEVEIVPNILYTKTEINNDLNHETIVCTLKNSDENDDFSDDLSLSTVSMDVDPTLEFNAFVENNIILNNSDLVASELDSSNSIVVMSTEIDNISHPVDISLENLNKTDINYQNSKSGISILPTGSSFVQEMSPEQNIDTSLQSLKQSLNDHTSMFDQSQYIVKKKSMVSEGNKQRKYSRKTMSHKELVAEFGLEKCTENHDNVFLATEENQQKKPSIVPTSVFNHSQFYEDENSSDKSVKNEANHETNYSRKSIAPTFVFNQSQSVENEDTSDKPIISKESQQQIYSRKSIAPTNIADEVLSIYENEDISDKSTIDEENQQNKYSRKSIASVNMENEVQYIYENEGISDKSSVEEENQQNRYSRKSIVAPTNMADKVQSFYVNEDVSDKSTIDEESQQKIYSRKSSAFTNMVNEVQSIYENEDISDKSTIYEENQQNRYSIKSITSANLANEVQSIYENECISDKSTIGEENQQNKYSRKSIAPSNMASEVQSIYENENISDKSNVDEENQQNRYSRKSIVPTNMASEVQSIYENENISDKSTVDEENQQNRYSRKSIVPTNMASEVQSIYENENISDKSTVDEENQQNRYSRKSIVPTNMASEVQPIYENEYISDKSTVDEENKQNMYSRKSIASTNIVVEFNSIYENEDISDKSTVDEENKKKRYSRKSIAPTIVANEVQSFYVNEDVSDKSIIDEEIHEKSLESQSYENEDIFSKSTIADENQKEMYSRKSIALTNIANEVQSIYENEDISDKSTVDEEIQQNRCSRKSIVPTNMASEVQSIYDNEDISDKSTVDEENQQNMYSRKSIAPTNMASEVQSFYVNDDVSDNFTKDVEIQQHMHSRKSIVPTSVNKSALDASEKLIEFDQKRCVTSMSPMTVHNQTRSPKNESISSNTYAAAEENVKKGYSRRTMGPTSSIFNEAPEDDMSDNLLSSVESNVSLISRNMDMKQLCTSNKKKSAKKSEYQSVLFGVINDDDLNSPFRKKSKKSINLTNQPVEIPLNEDDDDNQSENIEYESKMDISMEYESKNDDEANISSQKINMTESITIEAEENHAKLENLDGDKKEKTVVPSNEKDGYEPIEDHEIVKGDEQSEDNKNNKSTKINDYVNKTNCTLNSKDNSVSCDFDTVTNTICVEGISNMSITDETNLCVEKLLTGNRKRSYSSRDCAPLSCSSFVSKSIVEDCTNKDLDKEEFLRESPIKINDAVSNQDSLLEDIVKVDLIKEESFKENLSNEVVEFLTRWTERFIEKQLSLVKCTNREWTFNILDGNITLTVFFSNDHSFLKVENISFEIKSNAQNEIMMFGIQWILSKYNPKVYKQICFTSRDVELLLKSLLEDVHFISEVMNNMSYVKDVYCATFKDNKAEIVLHKMMPAPLMVRIEILLSNIHKLSIKDITVDRLFGSFDSKLLDTILENKSKDCKVLQFLIEELRAAI